MTEALEAPHSVSSDDLRDVAVEALKAWIAAAMAEGKTQAAIMGELMGALS